MSAATRARHRGLSHHTRTVLALLLAPVASPRRRAGRSRRRATSATTGAAAAADLDGYAPAGCPRARWAAGWTRTRCSSRPRSPAGVSWPAMDRSERMSFQRWARETVWKGRSRGRRIERFRHDDGEEVEREMIAHQGAVGVVAYDAEHVWLVRQPREAAGEADAARGARGQARRGGRDAARDREARAGRGDRQGRGRSGRGRDLLHQPGVHRRARPPSTSRPGLATPRRDPDEKERIEVVPWPLERLDEAIADCHDSKSLIGFCGWPASGTVRVGPPGRCWPPRLSPAAGRAARPGPRTTRRRPRSPASSASRSARPTPRWRGPASTVQTAIVRGRPPRNAVVAQDPRGGTRSHRGDTVNVSVSDGVAG